MDTPTSPFQIGDSLQLTNQGQNDMVDLVNINSNDPEIAKYSINFLSRNTKVVTKEFLK